MSAAAASGTALVLLAAGRGTRTGHETNKVLLPLAGRRVLTWSLMWARAVPSITDVVLVVRSDERETARAVLAREAPGTRVEFVTGGATRHESEQRALVALAPRIRSGAIDVVAVHDAARPLSGRSLLHEVVELAREVGGAVPVLAETGVVPLDGGGADGAGPVGEVVSVQTPQAFRAPEVLAAYEAAAAASFDGSDTASCLERFSDLHVQTLPGAASNIKITFPEDLFLAERLLARHRWSLG